MQSLDRSQLGKYQIGRELGRGGMGAVYEALDPLLHRQVAIKVLAPHLTWEQEFVSRFLREAQTVAHMSHPNIVQIYDIGEEEGLYYFVMEFLVGVSLRDYIRQCGRIPHSDVLTILRQLASALDYAHGQGVVHRDVKPANVIVAPDGKTTLTDFGIVKAADQTRLTATGMALGTPEYMAPEQAVRGEVTPATDRYALAVVAYEMLAGQVPFQAPSTMALLYQIAHDPPPPLSQSRPELAGPAELVLQCGLAKDPQARFPTCTAFVQSLEQALLSGPTAQLRLPVVPAPTMRAAPPSVRATRRGLPAWAWTLVGILTTLLVGVTLLLALGVFSGGGTPAATISTRIAEPAAIHSPDVLARQSSPEVLLFPTTPMSTPHPTPRSTPRPSATATPRPTATATPRPTDTPLPERLWLGDAEIKASSSADAFQDACGNPTHYDPYQVVDGDVTTTWRSAEDQVDNQWMEIDLGYAVDLERVGITPGFNKVDPCDGTARCRQNRRLREIVVVFSDGTRLSKSFPDGGCDMVYISARGITASWLRIEVLSTYPPEAVGSMPPRNFVAISEVEIVGYKR